MDGLRPLHPDRAEQGVHSLFGVSRRLLRLLSKATRRSWLASHALPRVAAYGGGFPIKVDGEIVGDRVSGGPTVQTDVDGARAALALVPMRCRRRRHQRLTAMQLRGIHMACRLKTIIRITMGESCSDRSYYGTRREGVARPGEPYGRR